MRTAATSLAEPHRIGMGGAGGGACDEVDEFPWAESGFVLRQSGGGGPRGRANVLNTGQVFVTRQLQHANAER